MTRYPQHLHSRAMFESLKEAGIIRDGEYIRRVVIDINVSDAVVIYIERYGDERLLSLISILNGVEIHEVLPDQADKGPG